jgi:hypothetical protein
VTLTQAQVRHSPDVDTRQPVSRQHEREFLRYYGYPEYWDGGGLWGMGAMPYPPMGVPAVAETAADRELQDADFRPGDSHLRSSASIVGYDIQASDGAIGQVHDYVFDDESWVLRYLVVDTRKWWPGGAKVLVGMNWVSRIDWAMQQVQVQITRAQLKSSPVFEDVASIHREYEMRLHDNVKRPGYWA